MALLSYRTEVGNGAEVNTDHFMNTTGEVGYFVVFDRSVSGLGASFDDTNSVVKLPVIANASGEYPAGVLLMDVVNKDLSRTHLNVQKREGQIGGKVSLLKRGVLVTNAITGGLQPAPGDAACLTQGGVLTNTIVPITGQLGAGGTPYTASTNRVGTFLSSKSSDGYAKVEVNIQ